MIITDDHPPQLGPSLLKPLLVALEDLGISKKDLPFQSNTAYEFD